MQSKDPQTTEIMEVEELRTMPRYLPSRIGKERKPIAKARKEQLKSPTSFLKNNESVTLLEQDSAVHRLK